MPIASPCVPTASAITWVSNDDRERVARALYDSMAEGRLAVGELKDRLDKVYAAKAFGNQARSVAVMGGIEIYMPGQRIRLHGRVRELRAGPARARPGAPLVRITGWCTRARAGSGATKGPIVTLGVRKDPFIASPSPSRRGTSRGDFSNV